MVGGYGVAVQADVSSGGVEPTLRKKREGWRTSGLERLGRPRRAVWNLTI